VFFPQINKLTKQMNGPNSTSARLQLTSTSQNHTLELHRSVHNLPKTRARPGEGYMPATAADVKKIADYIRLKVGHAFAENPPTKEYDRDFWFDLDLNENKYQGDPTLRCEVGSDKIISWFVNNQRFLTEIREKLVQTNIPDEESDDSDDSDTDN
jgi:hypothetical protein